MYANLELILAQIAILRRKNDINRTLFHSLCSLINPISDIKKKSKSTVFTMEYKRPISTGNIMHVKNQDSSIMA